MPEERAHAALLHPRRRCGRLQPTHGARRGRYARHPQDPSKGSSPTLDCQTSGPIGEVVRGERCAPCRALHQPSGRRRQPV